MLHHQWQKGWNSTETLSALSRSNGPFKYSKNFQVFKIKTSFDLPNKCVFHKSNPNCGSTEFNAHYASGLFPKVSYFYIALHRLLTIYILFTFLKSHIHFYKSNVFFSVSQFDFHVLIFLCGRKQTQPVLAKFSHLLLNIVQKFSCPVFRPDIVYIFMITTQGLNPKLEEIFGHQAVGITLTVFTLLSWPPLRCHYTSVVSVIQPIHFWLSSSVTIILYNKPLSMPQLSLHHLTHTPFAKVRGKAPCHSGTTGNLLPIQPHSTQTSLSVISPLLSLYLNRVGNNSGTLSLSWFLPGKQDPSLLYPRSPMPSWVLSLSPPRFQPCKNRAQGLNSETTTLSLSEFSLVCSAQSFTSRLL